MFVCESERDRKVSIVDEVGCGYLRSCYLSYGGRNPSSPTIKESKRGVMVGV